MDGRLLCCLLWSITEVCSQLCPGACQCSPSMPRCGPGVALVADGCGCCQVCAGQEGEACSARLPCDARRALHCDYSASFPGGPGQCVGRDELGCDLNGLRLDEGQTIRPSCSRLCHCLGGGLTCVSLCSDDLLTPPSDQCPNAQLLRLPGRCCKEWVCNGLDNSIASSPSADDQTPSGPAFGPTFGSASNCIEWSSDWSSCSHSCGPGVSTRTTNRNWRCRLQTETRLCQVRPCHGLQPGLRRLHPGSGECDSSFTSPLPVQLEHQGCWSTRLYRPRFCALSCPGGRCCSPAHTRTVRMLFRCPHDRLSHQQVMMIESCSCSVSGCRGGGGGVLSWL